MSMVARTEPRPAEDDITDTDDGDTRISAGAFWPDIVLRELRLAVRLPGRARFWQPYSLGSLLKKSGGGYAA